MTPEDILNEVVNILEDDTTLKGYVRKIFKGVRENIPKVQFPLIIVEPVSNPEVHDNFPNVRGTLTLNIFGYMLIYDKDTQLIGTSNKKGIIDLEKDIKKALGAYYNLNNKSLKFEFPDTRYDFSQYPIRGFAIDMAVQYQQNFETRA